MGEAPNPVSVLEREERHADRSGDHVETEADAGETRPPNKNTEEDHWELEERPLEGTKPAHTWISDLGLQKWERMNSRWFKPPSL